MKYILCGLLLLSGCAHAPTTPAPHREVMSTLSPEELKARGYSKFEYVCYGDYPYQRCQYETAIASKTKP